MTNIWNKLLVISLILLLFAAGNSSAQQQDWDEIAKRVNLEQGQLVQDTAEMERLLKMDEQALKKELADLQAQLKREETLRGQLESEFGRLRKIEDQHRQDLVNEQDEIEAIEGTVRGVANEAYSMSRDNPITAKYPERGDTLRNLSESRRFPGMAGIQTLVEFYFQEMEETGNIEKRRGSFVGPDGRETEGEILRIGRFTTYYRLDDGTVGFLLPESDGKRLKHVPGEVPSRMVRNIRNYFEGSNVAPFDLSFGGYFVQLTTSEDWRDFFEKGGNVMYAILAVLIFAILIGIERLIVLSTKARASDKVMDEIKDMAAKHKWQEARAYCSSKSRIPTCQMLDSVIEHVGYSQEVLENALQEAILKQVPKLERFIPTLALLAMISPLLGLLGTVSGMIQTFKVITEVGTGDPGMMAGGISQALLTTQFGLAVAIPILLLHHFLKSQVDKIVVDMQEKGTAFAVTLAKQEANVEE